MATIETVTVLITDLVGSTGLETRVGPGLADEIRLEHFGLIRGALAETGGKEVKNTGDGLMVAFDSAAAAVSCACLVQQRFERRNRAATEQLLVKIGLSVGDATVEGDDYFGIPVIEAARLCDRCSGGQILAKDLVAHLAGARGHAFVAVGALELKGLPSPMDAVEVVWERRSDERSVPLPGRLQEVPSAGLVGRVAERERLRELVVQVSAGERRLALISGEPGIGKTRLATHAALEARADGAMVLYGRCDEELAIPYGPWVEALAHLVAHADDDLIRAHVERHGGELVRLVPGLQTRVGELPLASETDPETERYLLWGAALGLLRQTSEREPVILILDDLHWADKPSLLLLKHVLGEGHGARLLIVGTYRESDLHRGHPLTAVLADLHREQGVERLSLGGFDQGDMVELMQRAAGHELDAAGLGLAEELLRETDGNPFYTGELLRHLLESGVIYREENGRFTVRGNLSQLGLPQSVRDVLGRRMERLGEDTQKILAVGAVIGREFDLDLLVAVLDRDEDELLELLEQAVAASVLSESHLSPGRFVFAHALVNHTLYEDLGPTRRARVHRRVAEALEQQLGSQPGVRVGELAHHWAKTTTPVDLHKAVAYARLAGERALEELAPDEAVRWFTQALELLGEAGEPAERCDLLIAFGEAQRQTGEAAFRETLLEASRLASELGDAERAARAALANSRGQASTFGEVDRERVAALERAVELDNFEHPSRCASLISLQTSELQYDLDHHRRRELAEQALELARGGDDERALIRVLRDSNFALWSPDTLEHRKQLTDELLEKTKTAGDPALEFWANHIALSLYIELGKMARALAALDRGRSIAAELGQPTLQWFAAYPEAGLAAMRGELEHAEELSNEALQLGLRSGQADSPMLWGANITLLRVEQGRAEEIIGLLEESVKANPGIPAWAGGLAVTYCNTGRHAQAAAMVQQAARDRFDHVPWEQVRTTALALYAEAAARTASSDAAAILYELIEPWGDHVIWNGATGYGTAHRYLGMLTSCLGRYAHADQHFARAVQRHQANGLMTWLAHTHVDWAESYRSRGDRQQAEQQAKRALELARAHGVTLVEARASEILRAEAPTATV